MHLKIEMPKNLVAEELVLQKNIPCYCRIAREFEIIFQSPLPEARGLVLEWDRKLLEERALAGGGGDYTHAANGMISIEEVGTNLYKIHDLAFFYTEFGWCQILLNGEYATPGKFWDDDEEDTIGR
ncbi:hypothetical protein [Undibacterium sp.]|uniref:hypothetical protein n=1 Tax=Undibacterium sp. TaxID=1914977 RepID=UPI002730D26F|nr:hypothetical protein [Undibacterium sp.]MDP1979221.1 hypothetical protein [Undibacterium sp.]